MEEKTCGAEGTTEDDEEEEDEEREPDSTSSESYINLRRQPKKKDKETKRKTSSERLIEIPLQRMSLSCDSGLATHMDSSSLLSLPYVNRETGS